MNAIEKATRESALREAAELVASCYWGDYWRLDGMLVSPSDLSDLIIALKEDRR